MSGCWRAAEKQKKWVDYQPTRLSAGWLSLVAPPQLEGMPHVGQSRLGHRISFQGDWRRPSQVMA